MLETNGEKKLNGRTWWKKGGSSEKSGGDEINSEDERKNKSGTF